jgi:hypothetical protein
MSLASLKNFAGTTNGSFYSTPEWVDTEKPPGHTSQSKVYPAKDWWVGLLTGTYLFLSPNFIWLVIALGCYKVCPPDMDAAVTWNLDWVVPRLIMNVSVTCVYCGWWHVTLYLFGWASRPFKPNRKYRVGKVLHNIWYTVLGAIQWTAWECVFIYCYATGRLPYISDADAFATPANAARVILWVFLVPIWRSIHFYLAHRLIHIKVSLCSATFLCD